MEGGRAAQSSPEARFDAIATAQRWEDLPDAFGAFLNGPGAPAQKLERVRRWLTAKVDAGEGTAGLAAVLAKLHRDAGRPSEAVFYLTYARALVLIDGRSCVDRTAPSDKLRNLVTYYSDLDGAFRALPGAGRSAVVDRAVALEAATWQARRRSPNRWLCSGGTDEMRRSVERGVPAGPPMVVPGRLGTQSAVPRDPSYVPTFRGAEDWARDRAELLPHLGDLLFQLARTPRAPSY
jgi:hypothetical protein